MGSNRGDVPGTSKPMHCGQKDADGNRCGKPATTVLDAEVVIMDKKVKVRVPFCEEHGAIFDPNVSYSISQEEA